MVNLNPTHDPAHPRSPLLTLAQIQFKLNSGLRTVLVQYHCYTYTSIDLIQALVTDLIVWDLLFNVPQSEGLSSFLLPIIGF